VSGPDRPVLDATAVLALIQDEPGAASLSPLLSNAVVGAVNAAEVLAKLVVKGVPREAALVALGALHLEVAPFDSDHAALSSAYVRRGVSLGDRCFLATVARYGTGWTSDRALAALPAGHRLRLMFFR
jgi:ribonuclease VapC